MKSTSNIFRGAFHYFQRGIFLDIHTLKDTSIAINRYIFWRWLILEAYFHSDPRLQEWVDQITEKLFSVCLLSGADSEAEFQRGSQIVTKVTNLLQGISMFPSEYLEDGLKQLLEQQLPDSRVINNFPSFPDTMSRMLHEGMMRAIDTQIKEDLNTIASSKKVTPENNKEDDCPNLWEAEVDLQVLQLDGVTMATAKDNSSVNASSLAPLVTTKPYGIIRKNQVPEQGERLKYVLSSIFPNVSVCWNLNLMGQTFLAQVEDILICLHNPEQPCQMENLKKEGWKVYICSSNDLMFPRRLERGIRQIQRLRKQ